MVVKDGNDFKITSINGSEITITFQEAFEVMRAVERHYYEEDVRDMLDDLGLSVTDTELDNIIEEYEDRMSDDDSWRDVLRSIIKEFKEAN
ncbi:hypothetical protein RASY3_14555 [Ruminococcus albus SY3]|uniref:Uncharacterized protein n=1 Tax=Ruminococcus albus SY3 TaxID=1341156 RepID=A0A011WNJ2_RUMAL|nr:hypothetical protein [Ruminococcus albus]EXM38540.1 hypothetical protein RASY3_14555 [Ruminococcus albus SY3]